MLFLGVSFFVTALLYATAGFGGGSTYNAILVLVGTDYHLIPVVSLMCNIVAVSSGVWHFYRSGHVNMRRILPWIVCSIPASFIGGMIPVSEKVFILVLGGTLLISGIRLLWPESRCEETNLKPMHRLWPFGIGTGLGLLAGITGIGGGIFLAPVLHFLSWGHAKQISGACASFILLNSIAGLGGQMLKSGDNNVFAMLPAYGWLFPAVLLGGQIGAWIGASKISKAAVKNITALLIIYVAVRLLIKAWELF